MFWEKKLGDCANRIRDRAALPLRIDLWNGQQLSLGHEMPKVITRIWCIRAHILRTAMKTWLLHK